MKNPDFPDCFRSATGMLLAKRLALYVPLLLGDQIPASIGRPLARALDEADRKQARMRALEGAVEILDGEKSQTAYRLSLDLEAALLRYERARKRIDAGHRQPSDLEKHLGVIAATGPRSWRKLYDEIQAFCPRDGKR